MKAWSREEDGNTYHRDDLGLDEGRKWDQLQVEGEVELFVYTLGQPRDLSWYKRARRG